MNLESNDFIKNAHTLITAGDFRLARKILTQGIYQGYSPSEMLYLIAQTYLKENNEEKAERVLRDSIAYVPTTQAYFALTRILVGQDKYERALQVLKRCLELKELSIEEKIELYKTIGNVSMKCDLIQQALHAYEKVLELKSNEDSYNTLGSCLLRLRDFEGAKQHFIKAMHLNPSSAKPYFGLASCAMGIGNKNAAYEFFIQCLERDIHNPTAVFYLVKCAFEIKKYQNVDRLLRQYLDVSPVNSSLLYSLAGVQYHLGKREELLKTLERIFELNPEHAGAKQIKNLVTV